MSEQETNQIISDEELASKAQATHVFKGRKSIKYLQQMKKRGEKIVQICPAGFNQFFTMAGELAGADAVRLVCENAIEGISIDEYLDRSEATIRFHRSKAPNIHINYMMETPMYADKVDAVRWGAKLVTAGADSFLVMGAPNETIKFMSDNYVPTYSHVGIISGWQTAFEGTYHRVGKTAEESMRIYRWAYEYQENGMGALTIEMTPMEVSQKISEKLRIPVVSIAGGAPCDGSEMVDMDTFGMNPNPASHAETYGSFIQFACGVYGQWVNAVKTGAYPQDKHGWHMDPAELDKFMALIDKE